MLFFHLHLGLGSDLLTSDFRDITLYAFLFQSGCHILFLTQSLWTDHRYESPSTLKGPVTVQAVATKKKIIVYLLRNTRHEVLIMQFFKAPVTSSFIGSCESHFPQHPVFDIYIYFFFNLRYQTLHLAKQQIMS